MQGKKNALAKILNGTGLIHLFKMMKPDSLLILNYHRVYEGELKTKFDRGVFGPSVEQFRAQMEWLKRNVNIISEKEVLKNIETNQKLKGRCVLITFDDGYIDNYTLAYPILKSLQIPAVYFIPTKQIEERRLGWWDLISYFVGQSGKEAIEVNDKSYLINTDEDKRRAIASLLNFMKTVKEESSKHLMEDLSSQCNVPFPSYAAQDKELMSWQQIAEVDAENVTIGSHTHSHRVLSTLSDEDQMKEMQTSKSLLEEKLNRSIETISYPVGNESTFTKQTKGAARLAGYKAAYSFNTGINERTIKDPYAIRRIGPYNEYSLFRTSVILPKLFFT